MEYVCSWEDGREEVTLFLDRDRGEGWLLLAVGLADEEDVATVYYSGAALHGAIWRGLGSSRGDEWKATQLCRVAAVVKSENATQ
jgi:hypothetical protein